MNISPSVSLDNVIIDINELERGMELTKREYEARKDRDPPVILKDFLNNSEDKMKKLKTDSKSAQVRPRIYYICTRSVCRLLVQYKSV